MFILFSIYGSFILYLFFKIKEEYYVHVCSLGTLCHSTKIIMDSNLKRESYPFDWIYSNPKNVIHMIEDEFKTFLNKSLYIGNDLRAGHSYYHLNLFNHHNPNDNEAHYQYFIRCVNRFHRLLHSRKKKLFIITFLNSNRDEFFHYKEHVVKVKECLDKRTTNYKLLVIFHVVSNIQNNYIFTHDSVDYCLLYTSISDGLTFDKPQDNDYIKKIIKNRYYFNIRYLYGR